MSQTTESVNNVEQQENATLNQNQVDVSEETSSTQNQTGTTSTGYGEYVGQVKWFNNSLCYGFITIVSPGDRKDEDIFVYHKNIHPHESEYNSLKQGEYVSFDLAEVDSEEDHGHKYQAINVRGVYGGSLMCDQKIRHNFHNHNRGGFNGRGRGRGRPFNRQGHNHSDNNESGDRHWQTVGQK